MCGLLFCLGGGVHRRGVREIYFLSFSRWDECKKNCCNMSAESRLHIIEKHKRQEPLADHPINVLVFVDYAVSRVSLGRGVGAFCHHQLPRSPSSDPLLSLAGRKKRAQSSKTAIDSPTRLSVRSHNLSSTSCHNGLPSPPYLTPPPRDPLSPPPFFASWSQLCDR